MNKRILQEFCTVVKIDGKPVSVIYGAVTTGSVWKFLKLEKSNAYMSSLEDKNKHLREKIQRQEAELLQSRKMADLGIMASGLAHEINMEVSQTGKE